MTRQTPGISTRVVASGEGPRGERSWRAFRPIEDNAAMEPLASTTGGSEFAASSAGERCAPLLAALINIASMPIYASVHVSFVNEIISSHTCVTKSLMNCEHQWKGEIETPRNTIKPCVVLFFVPGT